MPTLLLALCVAPLVQGLKLNGPMLPDGWAGNVHTFELSPDGARAVYMADQDTDDVFELYGVPADASAPPIKLNGPLAVGGEVLSFQISADSTRVVYLADQDRDGVYRLYGVPLDGSTGAQDLSGAMVAGGGLPLDHGSPYALSPDSTRVAFVAEKDRDGVRELYSVPLDGSAPPVKLNPPLTGNKGVVSFLISPDGTRAVYHADQTAQGRFELYSVPLDASAAPVALSGVLVTGGDVDSYSFRLTPDGRQVLFVADARVNEVHELFRVPLEGGRPPLRVSGPLVTGGDVRYGFRISPDGAWVAFVADADVDEVDELYRAPLEPPGTHARPDSPRGALRPRKLNGALVALGDVRSPPEFSPDGKRVVYLADQDTNEVVEVYSVEIGGRQPPVKLNGPLASEGGVIAARATPDGTRVVYQAAQDADSHWDLFSVPIDGAGAALRLSPSSTTGFGASSPFEFRGGQVVFLYDALAFAPELLTAPVDGSQPPLVLSAPLVAQGSVNQFRLHPDGAHVLYSASQERAGVGELYRVALDGSRTSTKLSGPLAPFVGDVSAFEVTPGGGRVVYLADQDVDDVGELYGATLELVPRRAKLSGTLGAGVKVYDFRVARDGARVVFRTSSQNTLELSSAPVDGSLPPVRLNGPLPPGGSVPWDGTDASYQLGLGWVVYRADQDLQGVVELYSAPLDASQPPVKLNFNLGQGQEVALPPSVHPDPYSPSFGLSPDGTRVFYVANQTPLDGYHVYSNLIDGSRPPRSLSLSLPAGYFLAHECAPRFGPDGASVFFNAQSNSNLRQVFVAPFDGTHPPLLVNPPLAPGRYVYDFQVTSTAERVVYRADQDSASFDLYSVPADGSQLSVRLNDAGEGVTTFALTPDGGRVVYVADRQANGFQEVYAVPVDRSQAPVRLSDPGLHGSVGSAFGRHIELTPDSARVVYSAGAPERLYAAPLDGSRGPVRIDDLDPGVGVGTFTTAGAGEALYLADRTGGLSLEAFLAPLDAAVAPRRVSAPLVHRGSLRASGLRVTRDGSKLVYLADQDRDGVIELYFSFLGPRPRPAPVPAGG